MRFSMDTEGAPSVPLQVILRRICICPAPSGPKCSYLFRDRKEDLNAEDPAPQKSQQIEVETAKGRKGTFGEKNPGEMSIKTTEPRRARRGVPDSTNLDSTAKERRSDGATERRSDGAKERRSEGAKERRSKGAKERRSE